MGETKSETDCCDVTFLVIGPVEVQREWCALFDCPSTFVPVVDGFC